MEVLLGITILDEEIKNEEFCLFLKKNMVFAIKIDYQVF